MRKDSIAFARALRDRCGMLVAGGPLPSCQPTSFVEDFDVVVVGEGERAMMEILGAYEANRNFDSIRGIVYREKSGSWTRGTDGRVVTTPPRELAANLDEIGLPARDLLPNGEYIAYWNRKAEQATTTVMTTRGCPFNCEYCSNAVFGATYRERSVGSVVDEVEQALSFGHRRIHFADDVFTLRNERVLGICEEIIKRSLHFSWECLGRVDAVDLDVFKAMRGAGCDRVFFGMESADESVLKLMRKKTNVADLRRAIEVAREAGLKTGAFFILCYPGETDRTVLHTIRFATSLPLDYLSFSVPYPIPGTALYERVRSGIKKEWESSRGPVSEHTLVFEGDFSEAKMKFAVLKGRAQFALKKFGRCGSLAAQPVETLTDVVFRLMK
jgi:anaerobic magnesium-protoporphyrin IX monomethyl ester cyclase